MDSVTHELAELDEGVPVMLVVLCGRLVLVGDPRVVSADHLARHTADVQAWMAGAEVDANRAADVLAGQIECLIKGESLALPAR
ncbi:hypothetical protein [Streptomyces sp. 1331.2]|uniref:hypothetical protein n=1 Tax=Streptomyces sp. 1331.2 TaxID=1938835 RepID=UPI000BCE2FFA|nr:hypothetical protein [Streptomyces sp. 1331.2]SOB83163.1 hypothetical protein SAMN06272789_3361 [Streptomyces sp. 1331.2]